MDGRRGSPAHTAQPVTNWGHLVNRAPLKYIDPTGHKEEGECPPGDPDCYKDDPLYELYTLLGFEDSMEYDTFRNGMIALAEIYEALEDFPLAGLRIEGTVIGLVGLDANLDIIWDWGNFDGDARLTLGWQVGADVGISGNAGLLLVGGMDNLDDYGEIEDHAGVTISDDAFLNILSIEADYGWSEPTQNAERVQSLFIGFFGAGEEAGIWRGGHIKSWSGRGFVESIYHFFENLRH